MPTLLTKQISDSEQNFKNLPYLIKKYSVSYGNSATIIFDLLYSLKCEAEKNFLGLAPFTIKNSENNYLYRNDTLKLSYLPSSKQEVKSIQKLIGGKIFEDSSATRQNFLSEAANYKILHIATHGIVNDLHPLESSLFFYQKNQEHESELKTSDLFGFSFNLDFDLIEDIFPGLAF